MSYLYGDSTPAPFEVNYLDLLRNVLEFSVSILLANDRMRTWQSGIIERERAALAHTRSLRSLGQSIERLLDLDDDDDSPTARCSATIAMSARDTVTAEVRLVESTLVTERERLREKIAGELAAARDALEQLLRVQDLPGADRQLRVRLVDGQRYVASARDRLPIGVVATTAVEIPSNHMFAEPVRVDRVVKSLELSAPEMRGWLSKKLKLVNHKLDKKYVAELVHGPADTRIALRSSPSLDDAGFDLRIGTDSAVITPVSKGGGDELSPYQLDEEQSRQAIELRDALVTGTDDLNARRTSLARAHIDDTPIEEHDDPTVLVHRFIELIAPDVEKISRHSPAPGELVLKVQIDADRREELFVSKADLWRILEPLSAELRGVFAPLHLAPDEMSPLDEEWSDDDSEIPPLPATD